MNKSGFISSLRDENIQEYLNADKIEVRFSPTRLNNQCRGLKVRLNPRDMRL